jgi:ubiquinol-cytochrome c reductase cytochrome b subunit
VALALHYSPSVQAAWASVAQLQRSGLGRFLRGLHAHGATFLLGVAALHLLQTVLHGAHRPPRARTFWLGLALLALLLAFCLTGSLLPWDERGWQATQITVGLAGRAPLVGPQLSRIALGGPAPGNATLTRFYALHVSLLPMLLLAFVAAHLAAAGEHAVAPPPGTRSTRSEPYWPTQALYDAAFSLLLLGALFALARARGAPLQGPADPLRPANPRPEWYFRPLFELLRLAPPSLEAAIALDIPFVAALFLALLPVIDRGARTRKPVLACILGGLLAAMGLTIASYRADADDPRFARLEALAQVRSQKAQRLAALGVPPEGALALLQNQPEERGARLFSRTCTECHAEGVRAPLLDGFLSKAWIRRVLTSPSETYGKAHIDGMQSYAGLGEEKLARLTDFLHALRSHTADEPLLESGRRLFNNAGCGKCHGLEPGSAASGPNLAGYGSPEWLHGFLRDPGVDTYYGTQNRMPDFGNRLSPEDLDDLVAWLETREAEEAEVAGLRTSSRSSAAPGTTGSTE